MRSGEERVEEEELDMMECKRKPHAMIKKKRELMIRNPLG